MRKQAFKLSLLFLAMVTALFLRGQTTNRHLHEFLLSAYNPPGTSTPAPPYPDTLFTDYKDAHMNIFLWAYDDDALLEKIHEYGFKYLLNIQSVGGEGEDIEFLLRGDNEEAPPAIPETLLQRIDELVNRYKNDPDLLGYYICDEPFANAFDNIAKVVSRIRKNDSTRFAFVNLWPYFPNEPGDNTPEEGDDTYLEQFIQKTGIELLSYDRYNFYNLSDDNEEYFNQMERIRRKAVKYNIPFCNIVQAIGTNGTSVSWDSPGNGEHLDWRTPGPAEHRWLVYSSLAYGVHGIIWFHWDCCDWGVIENPDRDTVYPSLQQINHEIDSLKRIMFGLTTTCVYHLNGSRMSRISNPPDVLMKTEQEVPLVAGFFKDENNNGNYFMLMNKDYRNGVSARVELDYKLTGLSFFDVTENRWENVPFEAGSSGSTFHLDLRAGGGKLFKFDGKKDAPREFEFTVAPNPVQNGTFVVYSIPQTENGEEYHEVNLALYSVEGKKLHEWVNETQPAGKYFVEFNSGNLSLSGGLYFCVLEVDNSRVVRKIIKP